MQYNKKRPFFDHHIIVGDSFMDRLEDTCYMLTLNNLVINHHFLVIADSKDH
jgi:hypothetical protein